MDNDYTDINQYLGLGNQARRAMKDSRAFEIMRLDFLMMEMGAPLLLNSQDAARFETLKQRKEHLAKQLYQLMKANKDI